MRNLVYFILVAGAMGTASALFADSSMSAFAQKVKEANPKATPYDILKKFYEEATPEKGGRPADFADFDAWPDHSKMECALVGEKTPTKIENFGKAPGNPTIENLMTSNTPPLKFTYVVKEGEPGNGPLFEGKPDIKKTTVIIFGHACYGWRRDCEEGAKKRSEATITKTSATDLVVDGSNAPVKFSQSYRFKDKLIVGVDLEEKHRSYYYCWR